MSLCISFLIAKKQKVNYTEKRKRTFVRLQKQKGDYKNLTGKTEKLTHFSSDEIIASYSETEGMYNREIESENDYLERKRSRAMRSIITQIVKNELDDIKRDVFVSAFFYGEKFSDIASRLGTCSSNVYKHYSLALKTIEQNLKYIILYRDSCEDTLSPLEKMRDRALLEVKRLHPSSFVMRLNRLMLRESICFEVLCKTLGLDKIRFEKIFSGEAEPYAEEIVLISGFFGVSTDYILKGDLT